MVTFSSVLDRLNECELTRIIVVLGIVSTACTHKMCWSDTNNCYRVYGKDCCEHTDAD